MFTIKINVFKFEKRENGNEEKVYKESFYTEGEKLKFNPYEQSSDGNLLTKIVEDYHGIDTFIVNPIDDPKNLLIIGYFDPKGDYKHLAIFSGADVYILQNGKTIDKYVV